MDRSLLALSCLLLAAAGVSSQPFMFGSTGGLFPSPLFGGMNQPSRQNSSTIHRFASGGLQSGLIFAGSGLNAVSSLTSNIPVFGSGFNSLTNMAHHGLGTIGAFGMGGLNAMESHRQSVLSAAPGGRVSQSFSSHSSSTQSGSNPPKTVTSSVTTITNS